MLRNIFTNAISEEHYLKIREMVDTIRDNVYADYNAKNRSHPSSDNAENHFATSISMRDALMLDFFRIRAQAIPSVSWNHKSKKLVSYFDKMIPRLTQVFGEKAVLKAIPDGMKTDEMITLTAELGGARISRVLDKSIQP